MADKITGGVKCLEADSSLCHWEFSYHVEHTDKVNSFCVVVKPEEMTDPTSESEAKTKANVKAKAIKDAWIATLATATSDVVTISQEESVTL